MSKLTEELKCLIIETLDLSDITPDKIENQAPLFIKGLGLDSIDALEIGVALQQKYQIKLAPNGGDLKEHFYSIQSIADYIESILTESKV